MSTSRTTRVLGIITVASVVILSVPQISHAQWIVHDPTTTIQNSTIASLKTFILETLAQQRERLRQMAERLSSVTSLHRYIAPDAPLWRIHDFESDAVLYAKAFHAALNYGDNSGLPFSTVALPRHVPDQSILNNLPPEAREILQRSLATLDAADSSIVAGAHQSGTLRFNGRRETAAINALEQVVTDPSPEDSATAVLDKVSAATLVEVRQNQARLQLLAALAEQLVIENKRTRDAEATALNMQLGHLRDGAAVRNMSRGAADDLRTWRQP